MQTFLPYPYFEMSAEVLDVKRLGKQRVEALQILKVIESRSTKGWANHPAVAMWRGYEFALFNYQKAICNEWTSRGYKDTCLEKSFEIVTRINCTQSSNPPWLGNRLFHQSHRSNLLRKLPEHYSKYFEESIANDLPYVWPTKDLQL